MANQMTAEEYAEIKSLLTSTDLKIVRLLAWAEGDPGLGTPSIGDQIKQNRTDIHEAKVLGHQNGHQIELLSKDVSTAGANFKQIETSLQYQDGRLRAIEKMQSHLDQRAGVIGGTISGVVAGLVWILHLIFGTGSGQ